MANAASTLTNAQTRRRYVQSFARGLEVIRSFSADAPRQTLTEVAGRSGLTRAGARRILLTLQTLGYVHNDGKLFSSRRASWTWGLPICRPCRSGTWPSR
jgi:IclR family pca regulon transcriptional regulator